MDRRQFDSISRSLATRTSRRQAVRDAGAGGLLGGLGMALGLRGASAQGELHTCALQIIAEVYVGPYTGTVYQGTLVLDIAENGAIDSGSFDTIEGFSVPLVGHAEGRALDLRIDLGNGQLLTFTGTADIAVAQCPHAAAGSFSGPEMGNMGTWITVAGSESAIISTTMPETPGDPPPACPEVGCVAPAEFDPVACVCVCPPTYPACGQSCCPPGIVCIDQASGTCGCQPGTQECAGQCVPACGGGEILNPVSCVCEPPCAGIDCEVGQMLDPETCECKQIILCPEEKEHCGDHCADLSSDATDCGSCGHECPMMPTIDDSLLPSLCVNGDCCLDTNMLCAANGDCCSGACDFILGGKRACA